MKTIFISIPKGIIARNILQTNVFRILKAQKDLRIVLIFPATPDDFLKKELGAENVIIEEWRGKVKAGILRHFILYPFMRNLVYTETSRQFLRWGSKISQPQDTPIRYFFGSLFFGPLSKIKFLKRFCRWLDFKFFAAYDKEYESLFDKYQPSLVFVSHLLDSPIDMVLVRIARRRSIPSVGMVKSWDNLDKRLLTVLPDTFLVWNEKMRDDLVQLQDVNPKDIIITGFPQFDLYRDSRIFLTRKEYCRQMGIDPAKKIIFFGSQWGFIYDDEIVEILHQFIADQLLKKDCVILVRPHFEEYLLKTGRFNRFKNYPYAVLDRKERTSTCFGGWNPSIEDVRHLANNLYHCDILVTSCSTLSIDGAVFDKPIINVAFDGLRERPRRYSYVRAYKYTHYKPVINSGGVKLVYNQKELLNAINQYLENPSLDSHGRERLRRRICYKLDGKAGQRIAEAILERL